MENHYLLILIGACLLACGYVIGRVTSRRRENLKFAGDLYIDLSSYGVEDMYVSWNTDLMPITRENEVLLKVIVNRQ